MHLPNEITGCGQEGLVSRQPASADVVALVLAADEHDIDGRSQWFYIRLPNGDLVLATYPQGDTYFATENDRQI